MPFHPIFRRLLLLEKNFSGLHLKPFYSVIQQRKQGSFYQGAEQINNNSAFLQIKKDHGGWRAYQSRAPRRSRHLFLEMFVFSCLLLSLFLILEGNKFIGMLHGLKKLWFFFFFHFKHMQRVGDERTAAQTQNSIVLCPSAPIAVYWNCSCCFFFGFWNILFWGIVYLLSQKLVWIIPDPTCSTQTAL